MELNADTVLVAVNDLHARTGKRVFTLIEIAEALNGGQRVTSPPDSYAPTDATGNPLPDLGPPFPAWVRVLNEILLHLGNEGQLAVETAALVVFPP